MQKLIAAAIVLVLGSSPVIADPGGKGSHGKKHETESQASLGDVLISAAEQAIIREYFAGQSGAAGGSLPPGIAKKVARGKPLPPGIAKKMPNNLAVRLSPPHGYAYRTVGADVVLVQVATGVIADLLKDVLR